MFNSWIEQRLHIFALVQVCLDMDLFWLAL